MSIKIHQKLIKAQNLINQGDFTVAINLLNNILENSPLNIDCLMLKAEVLLRLELFADALHEYATIVQLAPKNITALNNFSLALIRNSKYSDALEIINYVLEIDPSNFAAHINSCSVYQALREYQQALNASLKAIGIDPNSAVAYLNLGTALAFQDREEDARQAYLLASTLDPKDILIKINLAQLEERGGDRKSAIKIYEEILNLSLTTTQTELIKFYLSFNYLYFGDLIKGWDYYDYGFSPILPSTSIRSIRKFHQPRWTGSVNTKQKILIWREQGLGDEILFATCLPDLYDLNLNVILECEPRLVNIYKRRFPKWEIRSEYVDNDGYPIVCDFDIHYPLGSLPRIFRRQLSDFTKQRETLFSPDTLLKDKYLKLLEPYKNKIKVGISWRGGFLNAIRNKNYTSLLDWEDILKNDNCIFVNLQYGECEQEICEVEDKFNIKIIRWDHLDLKNDIESLIALISNLDHVVTVGTAVSTISASAGVHTILLTVRNWLLLGSEIEFPWFRNLRPLIAETGEMVASKIVDVPLYLIKQ